MEEEIKALEKELNQRVKLIPGIELLLGIPGINVLAALTIVAEIGDIKRFTSAKKLVSYAGLAPSVYQSGKTRYTGHITKAGRSMLRWIMIQVALQVVRSPGRLRTFYLRLKKRKGHKIAIVAAARKLLCIIWTMLANNREYHELRDDLRRHKIRLMEARALRYDIDQGLLSKIKIYAFPIHGRPNVTGEEPRSAYTGVALSHRCPKMILCFLASGPGILRAIAATPPIIFSKGGFPSPSSALFPESSKLKTGESPVRNHFT